MSLSSNRKGGALHGPSMLCQGKSATYRHSSTSSCYTYLSALVGRLCELGDGETKVEIAVIEF